MEQGDGAVILVVDDDQDISRLVEHLLIREGYRTKSYSDGQSFLTDLSLQLPDAVLLDIELPGLSGRDVLTQVKEKVPHLPVIMMTGDSDASSVVDAVKGGAYDYLTKPFEKARLVTAVGNAVERMRLRTKLQRLERDGGGRIEYGGIVGRSPQIRKIFSQLDRLAASDISVLLQGESGTGKELAARAIHDRSERADGPFVAVNCAAIPESLQDSELFGHERGAFTGAHQARAGRFERAHRGTLFLDEVAELNPVLQAKLLRVLQEQQFERVGGNRFIRSEFRLIAATHRNLRNRVKEGSFREDLYFRMAVFELLLPPIRDRVGDLELLISHLLDNYAAPDTAPTLHPSTLELLRLYPWPGNVRELGNVLKRALLVAEGGIIHPGDLPRHVEMFARGSMAPAAAVRVSAEPQDAPAVAISNERAECEAPRAAVIASQESSSPSNLRSEPMLNLRDLERWAITVAMSESDGNVAEVSRRLGIGRTTLYRKLKSYDIG